MNDKTKDLIELPGPFSFKVIVKPELADEQALLALTHGSIKRALGEIKVSSNVSKGGKYRSYTLTLRIHVYEEIETLYKAYQDHPASVWVI